MATRIRVRLDELARVQHERGIQSRYALAKALGMNKSTIGRILDGTRAPGEQFIATTLHRLNVSFDEIFEVVKVGDGTDDEVSA